MCAAFVGKSIVIAAGDNNQNPPKNEHAASGNSGQAQAQNTTCGSAQEQSWSYSTCYGATWRYETWPAGATEHVIEGGGTSYTQSAYIGGTDAQICAKAGGYYRYAMVNRFTGEQKGTIGISGHGNAFDSQMLPPGTMHYRGPTEANGGEDWNTVVAAYNAAVEKWGQFGQGFVYGSQMSWFCAEYDGAPTIGPPIETDDECPGIPIAAGYKASTDKNGYSSVRTQVRMTSTNGSWTTSLYAKPNDGVAWRHCYFPGMQMVANKKITTSKDNEPTTIGVGKTSITLSDRTFPHTNSLMKLTANWDNLFNIKNKDGNVADYNLTNHVSGDSKVKHLDNNWSVDQSWVGNTYSETSNLDTNLQGGLTPYHAWVSDPETHEAWTCTWTHTVQLTGEDAKKDDRCWKTGTYKECYGSKDFERCSDIEDKETKCGCNEGRWDWHKYYVSPCSVSVDSKYDCTHGSGDSGIYYPYGRNKTLYTGDKSTETATVSVPYNFDMSADIKLQDSYVYAGESAKLGSGSVTVGARWNGTTQGYYSTRVPGVKIQIITFISNSPVTSVPNSGNVRYGPEVEVGELSDGQTKSLTDLGIDSVNVDDIPAGQYFCVGIQVSPGDSGSDTTMNSSGFSGYKKSGADCKQIAKRPSFQIWGGSLYSNGEITASRAVKNNLYGFNDRQYSIAAVTDGNVFGSFDELSVMTLGLNIGLASGAATGDLQGGWSKSVGKYESDVISNGFCKYESPLSFANYSSKKGIPICGQNNSQTGMFGTSVVTTDKYSYISSITNNKKPSGYTVSGENPFKLGKAATYSEIISETNKVVLYTYSNDPIHLSASNVDLGQTYVVHSKKTVNIDGDIIYNGTYGSLNDIPKVIIYSETNIGIGCAVKRVDAVLIAEGVVDTCSGNHSVNNQKRSNQLQINGTVIANELVLKRTYGAGAGKYSSIPAEILNYDSTLVMWARHRADTGNTGVLNSTYIHELAPRY